MPNTMSQSFGTIERSKNSSPPRIRYTAVATPAAARSQSHHMTRWRKRFATGKIRKVRNSTKATCDGAQVLRADNRVGGVEMEKRHHHGHHGDQRREPALQLVLDALLALDHLLGALQGLLAHLGGRRVQPGNLRSCLPLSIEKPRQAAWAGLLVGAGCYWILTPFSAKYFTAPGCQGSGEAAAFWFSSLKFSASLCTRTSSSFFSKMVLTML